MRSPYELANVPMSEYTEEEWAAHEKGMEDAERSASLEEHNDEDMQYDELYIR